MSEPTPESSGDDHAPGPSGEGPRGDDSAGEQRRLRLEHHEAGLERRYSNAFRTFTASEEVVVDFGFNLVRMDNAPEGADGRVSIDWTGRTVLSYRTAKLLAMDLARIIRDHERSRGEIPVSDGPGPGRPAAGEPGGDS